MMLQIETSFFNYDLLGRSLKSEASRASLATFFSSKLRLQSLPYLEKEKGSPIATKNLTELFQMWETTCVGRG